MRLRPAPHCRTPIVSYSLQIEPENHFLNWQQDPQGNYLARLVFPEMTDHFEVEVDLVAEMTVINPFDFFLEPTRRALPVRLRRCLGPRAQAVSGSRAGRPAPERICRRDAPRHDPHDRFSGRLNQRVQRAIGYVIRMDPGVQTSEETLTLRKGSCRDSAWLLVQVLRHLGLAARFVSGYLIQLVPDVKSLDGPAGATEDFTDLHAWTEVYLPGAGWVGLDPTSGLFAGEGHIPLACSPDPPSAAPITGARRTVRDRRSASR